MCDDFFLMGSLYIDEMLDDEEKKIFLDHLASCECCSNGFNELLALTNELKSMEDVQVPDNLHSFIMNGVTENIEQNELEISEASKKKKEKSNILKFDFRRKYAYAAACIAIVAISSTKLMDIAFNALINSTPSTSVMASNLNLEDKNKILGEPVLFEKNVSVVIRTDDMDSISNELYHYMSDNCLSIEQIQSSDTSAFMIGTMETNKVVPFVSNLVDTYENTTYVSKKNNVNDDIKQIDEFIDQNKQIDKRIEDIRAERVIDDAEEATIVGIDDTTKARAIKQIHLHNQKQELLDKTENTKIQVTIIN